MAQQLRNTELNGAHDRLGSCNFVTDFHRFEVRAAGDSETIPRLLNFFAQRGLTPQRVRAELVGGRVYALFEQAGLEDREAQIIVEKMRSSVLVEYVSSTVCPKTPSTAAQAVHA